MIDEADRDRESPLLYFWSRLSFVGLLSCFFPFLVCPKQICFLVIYICFVIFTSTKCSLNPFFVFNYVCTDVPFIKPEFQYLVLSPRKNLHFSIFFEYLFDNWILGPHPYHYAHGTPPQWGSRYHLASLLILVSKVALL